MQIMRTMWIVLLTVLICVGAKEECLVNITAASHAMLEKSSGKLRSSE